MQPNDLYQSISILIKFEGKIQDNTSTVHKLKIIVIGAFKNINSLYRWNVLGAIYQNLSDLIPFTELHKIFFIHFTIFEVELITVSSLSKKTPRLNYLGEK